MTVGEKIKRARKSYNMTQAQLAENIITRNMLSAIENDKATPSLETLKQLSVRLRLPLSYLLSDDEDLFYYQKKDQIGNIKNAFTSREYDKCITLIDQLERIDDELAFILANCYFELTTECVKGGSLKSAKKHSESCEKYCNLTIYDTQRFVSMLKLLTPVINNINSPLLEFNEDEFKIEFNKMADYDFYKYLTLDSTYEYTNFGYSYHLKAKGLIKERKYHDALKILLEIEDRKSEIGRNAFLMFGVYTDLDHCYRQLFDFENAYRYSSKRISLMEGFNA